MQHGLSPEENLRQKLGVVFVTTLNLIADSLIENLLSERLRLPAQGESLTYTRSLAGYKIRVDITRGNGGIRDTEWHELFPISENEEPDSTSASMSPSSLATSK